MGINHSWKAIIITLCIGGLIVVLANKCSYYQGDKNAREKQTSSKIEQVKTAEELRAEQEQQEQQRFAKEAQREPQLSIEQILEKELLFFDKPFDVYSHCKTEATMQNLLGLFGAWAALIEARESSEDAEVQKLTKQLKNKVIKCQAEAFPILRQEYPKVIKGKIKVTVDKLGIIGGSDVEYVDMQVSGYKSTHAIFTWWGLISDNNKVIFQRKIFDTLTILRFTQAKLQSDTYDSEPSHFAPYKGKDTDLIIL